MSQSESDADPLLPLAEEFAYRCRRGERPTLTEYAEKYPELAERIRRLFPAMAMIEDLGSVEGSRTGVLAQAGIDRAQAPRQLGEYLILREIGRGGMGVVYEAEQVPLARRVALKVLPRHALQDDKALERFRREARAAARLHHTNIVPVFEVGLQGEVCYYAMQFITGLGLDAVIEELRRLREPSRSGSAGISSGKAPQAESIRAQQVSSLAQSLLTGRLELNGGAETPTPGCPLRLLSTLTAENKGTSEATPGIGIDEPIHAAVDSQVCVAVLPGGAELSTAEWGRRKPYYRSVARIGQQAAGALAYSHARGVVHRDIKPSNLLLDTAGVVWITDFGLAKAQDDALTATGDIVGTLRYMAPERFRGEGNGRADVYSLGLTLYELLTLRPAFETPDRMRLIELVKTQEPPRPRSIDSRIPRDLETIVQKAIDKDPRRRYLTADELAEDLRRFLGDEPIRARRVSWVGRVLRWGRRNKLVASLLGGLAVTLIVGLAVSTSQWIRAESNAWQLAQQLYTSDMIAIQQAWEAGNTSRMGELLRRHIPRPGRADWRGFEWYVFWRQYQRAQPIHTFPLSDTVWHLAATPNGQTVAALSYVHAPDPADERVEVTLWNAASRWEPRTFSKPPKTFASAIALSPDGSMFATGGDVEELGRKKSFVTLWDSASGAPLRRSPEDHGAKVAVGALAFSLDGKRLLWGDFDTTINLWDLVTGAVTRFRGHKDKCRGVEFDPKCRWIASASWDGTVKLWDLESGHELLTFANGSFALDVAFSPDGRYLAAGNWFRARMWDLIDPRNPREIELKGQTDATTFMVSFSPDGRYLAAGSSNTVRLWDVGTGEVRAKLKGHSSLMRAVAFLDGGRTLATGSNDRTVKLWDVARAEGGRDLLTGHAGSVESLAFTPDGRSLVSGGTDAPIRRWDVATGHELTSLADPGVTRAVNSVAISADGRTLADDRVSLWDLGTGRRLELCPAQGNSIAVAFSPDGLTLATTPEDGVIWLWDMATRKRLRKLTDPRGHSTFSMAFSPDGRILASAGTQRVVRLWDTATGRELPRRLVGHTAEIWSIAFAPDGRALASASWDGTVIIWDVADAANPSRLVRLEGHIGAIWAVAYSPDGSTIACGSEDGTVKLWDPTTGRERCTLVGHNVKVRTLAFSPDGSVLATADAGGTIRLWRR